LLAQRYEVLLSNRAVDFVIDLLFWVEDVLDSSNFLVKERNEQVELSVERRKGRVSILILLFIGVLLINSDIVIFIMVVILLRV
jgi:hypothetical protein